MAIAYVSVHIKESRSTHPKNACSIILLSFSLKKKIWWASFLLEIWILFLLCATLYSCAAAAPRLHRKLDTRTHYIFLEFYTPGDSHKAKEGAKKKRKKNPVAVSAGEKKEIITFKISQPKISPRRLYIFEQRRHSCFCFPPIRLKQITRATQKNKETKFKLYKMKEKGANTNSRNYVCSIFRCYK